MTEIRDAFSKGKAFVAFLTCGDPDLDTTVGIIESMQDNGVDLIELGIPFSDPTAEGPVIQEANVRALSAGTTTDKIFDMLRQNKDRFRVPMVFMTYANVVFSYGNDRFLSQCKEVGIKGLILPDVPFEEKGDFLSDCERYDVDLISMVAPTSENRIAMISKEAKGFVYVVSSLGVTGVRSNITTDIGALTSVIRQNTGTPCAIGFGISTPEQAKKMSANADGVIVGSAIMRIVAEHGTDSPRYVGEYVRSMKDAIS